MESRKFPRMVARFPCSFIGEEIEGKGTVLDLSTHGCSIHSDKSLHVGNFVKLQLTLPDGDPPVDVDVAVCRWSYEQKFGVEFINVGPASQSRLQRYMKTPGWVRQVKKMFGG